MTAANARKTQSQNTRETQEFTRKQWIQQVIDVLFAIPEFISKHRDRHFNQENPILVLSLRYRLKNKFCVFYHFLYPSNTVVGLLSLIKIKRIGVTLNVFDIIFFSNVRKRFILQDLKSAQYERLLSDIWLRQGALKSAMHPGTGVFVKL